VEAEELMKISKTLEDSSAAIEPEPLVEGTYLCSEIDLFCVECVGPERVLLEDCRTSTLLDVSLAEASGLRRIIPEP
jgi:hypothetical protein